jgi:hypothetical protein
MAEPEDLNSIAITATVRKMPEYRQDWSFLEVVIHDGHSTTYVSLHIPDRLRRQLYHLSIDDRIYARGSLCYVRSDSPTFRGQHVVKVEHLQPIHRHGKPISEEALSDGHPAPGRRYQRRHRRGKEVST